MTMIIRALRLRHGRLALPKSPSPLTSAGVWRRCASSLDGIGSTSASVDAAVLQTSSNNFASADSARKSIPLSRDVRQSQASRGNEAEEKLRTLEINDPEHPVAQAYALHQHEKSVYGSVGSTLAPYYKPHELLTNPPRPEDITLELLLASGAHLGHATQLWHPGNAQYIYGIRGSASGDPIHIISLDVTASHLRRACKIVQGVAEAGGIILFVGTRNGQARAVVKAASMAKGYHLFSKWIPGSITNGQQILGNCDKKVIDEKDEEVPIFGDQLPDVAAIKPDLVVCLNPMENYILLRECGQNGIPTIGIVDTDCNPTWVTYPIPSNDDSPRAVQVIAGALGRAGEEGHRVRLEAAQEGVMNYQTSHTLAPPRGDARRTSGKYDRRSKSATRGLDANNDVSEASMEDQYEDDMKLLALLNGTEYEPPAVRNAKTKVAKPEKVPTKERDADTFDASLLSDEHAMAGEAQPEVLKEDLVQLQDAEVPELDDLAAEPTSASYNKLSSEELDDLMRIYSGAEQSNDTSSTSATKHADAASPIAQEFLVEDVQKAADVEAPAKQPASATEESSDAKKSTRDQASEVATELGEAVPEKAKEDLPSYHKGDAVPEEAPAAETSEAASVKETPKSSTGKKQK